MFFVNVSINFISKCCDANYRLLFSQKAVDMYNILPSVLAQKSQTIDCLVQAD